MDGRAAGGMGDADQGGVTPALGPSSASVGVSLDCAARLPVPTVPIGRVRSHREPSQKATRKPEGRSLMVSLGRVLVVEDEPEVALVLHDALQDFGYEVRVAVDGHEAVRLAVDYQPAAVLLDLWLPGLPGESVLEALRRQAPSIPIIIVSGNRDDDRARVLLKRGAFDYIPKPFDLSVLERAVGAAVAERHRSDK